MKSATKFVVVEMPVDKNNSKLISFLESNDYADIFCLRSLTAHPAVQKYVDEQLEKKECDNCKLAETIITSSTETEVLDVKPEAVRDELDTVEHNDAERKQTASMNTANHTTKSSHGPNAEIANKVNNKENIQTEPRIGAISPAPIVQQTDHTKLIDHRLIIKTKPAKISTITAREMLTEPANCGQNHPSEQIEKDIRGVSEESTGEVSVPSTPVPIIWLKRRGELTKGAKTENACGTPTTVSSTLLDSQKSERLQPEPIHADNQHCSGNMDGHTGNLQSPLVIWLKQRNTKQTSGYRIQETKSKAEVNLSPSFHNGENSRNQNMLDASATCNDMNRSDDAEMIPTDDIHSENSDAMNTSDDDEVISTDDNDSEISEELLEQDSFSSEHQERDESVSGQIESSPSSPTISLERKTLKRSNASPKTRNVRVKGAGGNIKKSTKHSRSSLPKTGKDIAQQKAADAPIKCMVCFKDVNLQIKRKTVIESLLAHAKTHADIKQYHCTSEGCDYSCTNKIRITIHMKYNHNIHGIGKNVLNGELRKSWVNSFERCYPTLKDELAEVKRTQSALQSVKRSLDTVKCKICLKDVNRQSRGKSALHNLLQHAQFHCEKKKFHCTSEDCDYSFATSGNARKHMKSMHNIIGTPKSKVTAELKQEWLEMFQRCYPTLENELASLKNRTQKAPETTEKCMVCLKSIKRRSRRQTVETLLCHARHHSDLKRYRCTVEGCNYSSVNSRQTVIHMKSNHNIVGFPKDMLNDELKKSWAESFEKCYPTLNSEFAELKETVCLLNLPTKVRTNGVLKNSAKSMVAHIKLHCDKKQFRCTVKHCNYSSTRVLNVKTHLERTHGKDDKPYDASAELKEAWQKTFKMCFPNYNGYGKHRRSVILKSK